MALINRDPRVINDWTKGNKNDVPSMELYRLEKKSREDEDSSLWAALRQEIRDRIADVDAEEAARIADVDAEEAARIAADNALWAALRKEISDRIADVDAEEAARIAGDNALWAALRQEIADRIKDVDNEEADRKAAAEAHRLASDPHPNLYFTGVLGMLPGTRVYCY